MGTETDRIIFTTSATSPAAGAWVGIVFETDCSPNSILSYCDISYGGKDTYYAGNISIANVTVTVSNCNISNSEQYGIYLIGEGQLSDTSTGNVFTSNGLGDIGTNE